MNMNYVAHEKVRQGGRALADRLAQHSPTLRSRANLLPRGFPCGKIAALFLRKVVCWLIRDLGEYFGERERGVTDLVLWGEKPVNGVAG